MKLIIKYFFLLTISINLNAQEWTDFSMPDDTTILHKMCKVDDHYWAIDYGYGGVFHSKDNGENWKLQYKTEGDFLEAIQFLDKKIGFLSGDYGIVMKTIDGGNTWKEIAPEYAPRITKANPMEKDSTAIIRYYYGMHFKDEDNGLLWGYEYLPLIGFGESRKFFYYQTATGGKTWNRIAYKRGEDDSIRVAFLSDAKLKNESAMGFYYANEKIYNNSRRGLKISKDEGQSWEIFPVPQFPDDRYMLRTLHFISDHQGYIFGGNLKEESQGYIYETLDGGKSWSAVENDLPHIHYSLQNDNELLLAGKNGLVKKWKPAKKETKTIIHKGDNSRILIDGQIRRDEWAGANKTTIKPGIDLYSLHNKHYVYLSVQYDTTMYKNYYCDLYFDLGNDTLLNIHASQQLGERLLKGTNWTDSEPAIKWGDINSWTANEVKYDREHKVYLPYTALEFQISKKKLPEEKLKISLQSKDFNWEKDIINFPEGTDFKANQKWFTLHYE